MEVPHVQKIRTIRIKIGKNYWDLETSDTHFNFWVQNCCPSFFQGKEKLTSNEEVPSFSENLTNELGNLVFFSC